MEITEQRDLLLQHDPGVYSGNPRVRQYNLNSLWIAADKHLPRKDHRL